MAILVSVLTLAFLFLPAVAGVAAPAVTTVDLTPATATNAVGSDHTVTATVMTDGVAASGEVVLFSVSSEGTPTPADGSDTTDLTGKATFTFSNDAVATNTITACVDLDVNDTCDAGEPTDTAQKTWQVAVATSIDVTPATASNTVGATHTVTATVTDQFDDPFVGAHVHFVVTGVGTPTPSKGDAVTDALGEGDFAFSNETAGVNTITACIDTNANEACDTGETSDTAQKTWTAGAPTAIALTPETAVNHPGDPHTVTATVTDEFDNPVAGAVVKFSVSGGGTPDPLAQTRTTGAAGQATFTFTNTEVAANTINACVDVNTNTLCDVGEPTDSASKSWEEPAATTIALAPSTATNPVGSDHTVTATVEDQFGDPVQGADVHFDVTGDGTPSPDATDATTDAAGEADLTFSNDTVGTNTITACIDEDAGNDCDVGEPTATATKTWEEPQVAAVFVAPSTATNPIGATHTVHATVVDQFDDPVLGVHVLFDVTTTGTATPPSDDVTTDANGEADFAYSNDTVGTDTITACVDEDASGTCDGGELTATASKTWTPPVEECPGYAGDPRNDVVGTPGNDALRGTPGRDIICGLGGNDVLRGLDGRDVLVGGRGSDDLYGGAGNDQLFGGRGADLLNGGPGRDRCSSGPGRDKVKKCESG